MVAPAVGAAVDQLAADPAGGRRGDRKGTRIRWSRMSPRLPCVEDEEEDVAVDEIGRGDELQPVALRVSSAVGREDDAWRIVSRHADPITAARPPTSVVQRG